MTDPWDMKRYYIWEDSPGFGVRMTQRMDGYETLEEAEAEVEQAIKVDLMPIPKPRPRPRWIMAATTCIVYGIEEEAWPK